MPTRILITCLLLLVFNVDCISQKFFPGFIVKKNGEVVKGEISARGRGEMIKEISFKTGDKTEHFTANDIAAFGRDNLDYRRAAIVTYHTSPLEIDKVKEEYSDETATDTVFLVQLLKGKYSLYQLQSPMRTCYFISKDNGPVEELVTRAKLLQNNVVHHDAQYKEKLHAYAAEEGLGDEAISDLMQTPYESYTLKDAVTLLNKNHGGSSTVKNTAIKSNRLEVGLGAISTKYTGTSSYSDQGRGDFLSATNFPASIGPRISIGLQFGPATRYTRLKGIVTLVYSTALFKGSSPVIAGSANQQMDFYKKFSIVDASLGAMVLFNPARTAGFYINPFLSANFIVNGTMVKNTGITPDFPNFSSATVGVGAGLGYMFDAHRVELRGEHISGNYKSKPAIVSSARISLSYHYTLSVF